MAEPRHEGGPRGLRGRDRGGVLGTLYRYELKMLLRDRRVVIFSILLPILVLPALLWIMKFTEESGRRDMAGETLFYAVTGTEAALARDLVTEALALPDSLLGPDTDLVGRLEEKVVEDPDSLLAEGDLHVVVRGLTHAEWTAIRDSVRQAEAARSEDAATRGATGASADSAGSVLPADALGGTPGLAGAQDDEAPAVPALQLRYRASSDRSDDAAEHLRDRLLELRDQRRDAAFAARGSTVDPDDVATVELREAASAERASGAVIGMFLTPLLLMLILTGGSVVAADSISGEKERGTLETLLTTGAQRGEIVLAKGLVILTVAAAITVINVANLLLYVGIGLFELPAEFAIAVPAEAVIVLLLLFLPLAALITAVLLMLSGMAKTYKEFQVLFFPVFLGLLVPGLAAVLPGIDLRSGIALVPIANVAVAVREVLVGEYDWLMLAFVLAVNLGLAVWASRLTTRMLSAERLITASDVDRVEALGGPDLFPRRVLQWFAMIWAVFFLVTLWAEAETDIRLQIVINLVGIFFGASLLMIRRYRLDVRETLALRAPPPEAWLAVLIGVPSALLFGLGLGQAADLLFPVPERLLESFGQYLAPDEIPLWQIFLFIAVMPGLFEEIAFRGVLLHGLRQRMGHVGTALVCGAVFGIFHVSLFRLVPTAYLGVVLASVTLLTGSIYPAMVWHALNNALALWLGRQGFELLDRYELGSEGWWLYAAATAGLAATFWLLWVHRRPLPAKAGRARRRSSALREAPR